MMQKWNHKNISWTLMNNVNDKLKNLSRTISHALRHEPWIYELELDEEGWVSVERLVNALQLENTNWSLLTESDIAEMIACSEKKRHELCNGKIRALYGHSTPNRLIKEPAVPPNILYHGTSSESAKIIIGDGLNPMDRQYVHLSVDLKTASQVGQRKAKQSVILKIKSLEGYQAGISFYRGNDCVWLADSVPPEFIELL
jgi:putative RNA 2'-phosphotransferase